MTRTPVVGTSGTGMNLVRGMLRWLVSVGPLAGAVASYELALDHIPESWFEYGFVRYLLAALIAICVGLGLKLLGDSQLNALLVQSEDTADIAPPRVPAVQPVRPVDQLFDKTAHRIVTELRSISRRDVRVVGWPQFLQERQAPPSGIGTAYGLRIVMALDIRDPRVNRRSLVESLIALQRDGGGWAASTQRGVGRPEVTAWVLEAAARGGLDEKVLAELLQTFDTLAKQDDAVIQNRTTVVSSVVAALSLVAPQSPLLPRLVQTLVDGASVIDNIDIAEPVVSWGESLRGGAKQSSVHTARAVVALGRARQALVDHVNLGRFVDGGANWLSKADLDFTPPTELLRRPRPDGDVDALVVGHFSSSWVARALMTAAGGTTRYHQRISAAIDDVWTRQKDGVWEWTDGTLPIWMTYQGIAALRAYSLHSNGSASP